MKSKYFLIPVLLLSLLSAYSFMPGQAAANEKNDRIEVLFTRNMSFNDIVKVKLDMAERGITLNYKLLRFDDEGRLMSISYEVDCHDGFKGSAVNHRIGYNDRFGFYRDYRSESSSPFGTGWLTEE